MGSATSAVICGGEQAISGATTCTVEDGAKERQDSNESLPALLPLGLASKNRQAVADEDCISKVELQLQSGSDEYDEVPPDEVEEDESPLEGEFVGKHYTKAEVQLIRTEKERWLAMQSEVDKQRRASELADLLELSRNQLRGPLNQLETDIGPANRFGNAAELPAFIPGVHVPILALINPFSGGAAGRDILSIASRSPYYQNRFFNIINVVKDQRRGGLLDVFRIELCNAKDEAKALGTRARVISGGGDGTASFALFIIFAALRADESRADESLADTGNGFIWTDDELTECFPALAQMPLGSANDFGHTLGWGQKYPGDENIGSCGGGCGGRPRALFALQLWIEAVMAPASRIVNFDVFGIMPLDGQDSCDFKVCELTGRRGPNPKVQVDGMQHLLMKEASTPVPLFCCLYFSTGFAAYMTARFQLNRRRKALHNKLEYARQAAGILLERVPPQLNIGLEGVEIFCAGDRYFPPRAEEGNSGRKYREVGFMNINWQGGMAHGSDRAPACARVCSTREPAKFNDGMMDMYRLKLASAVKNPGLQIQTDKREGGMTMTYTGGQGKGVFFQWDGESRFAFSPGGRPFNIHIRKIINIPVVLGPEYNPRITGDPYNDQPVHFGFSGDTLAQRTAVRRRILRNVQGELNSELNATHLDIRNAGLQCETK